MKEATETGMNRTGMALAPREGSRMAEEAWTPPGAPTLEAVALRAEYAMEAQPLGSVPPPATAKGLASTLLQKAGGRHPAVLIDKLGERLAFERTGTRLYELLLGKHASGAYRTGSLPVEELRAFRDEEMGHFQLVWQMLEKIGADPTAVTPCADLAGVESQGLLQSLADPRTTFAQGLQAILTAELVDNEGWSMLIGLCVGMGQDEMAEAFGEALRQEEIHLVRVRAWLSALQKQAAGAGKG